MERHCLVGLLVKTARTLLLYAFDIAMLKKGRKTISKTTLPQLATRALPDGDAILVRNTDDSAIFTC